MKYAESIKIIVCDDVRHELNGKMSLMGLYIDNLIVQQIPTLLSKLFFVIMVDGIKKKINKIHVTIYPTEGDPVVLEQKSPFNTKIGKSVNFVMGFSPFEIKKEGEFRMEVKFSKNEKNPHAERRIIFMKGKVE